jgi:ABC-type phosphate transport system permease subunit
MNDEELTTMIIKELGKHHDRQEIVRKICEQTSKSWSEAEQFLAAVETQNRRKIAVRQGPLLMLLSIGTLLLGIGLVAYNLEILVAIFSQDLLSQIASARTGYYRLIELLTGAAMIIGGFWGIWTTLGSFFSSD